MQPQLLQKWRFASGGSWFGHVGEGKQGITEKLFMHLGNSIQESTVQYSNHFFFSCFHLLLLTYLQLICASCKIFIFSLFLSCRWQPELHLQVQRSYVHLTNLPLEATKQLTCLCPFSHPAVNHASQDFVCIKLTCHPEVTDTGYNTSCWLNETISQFPYCAVWWNRWHLVVL